MKATRNRRLYALLILVVVAAGLASRSTLANHLPAFIGEYAGDTLWALMVYLLIGFALPALRPGSVGLLTIAISFGVEISQLYQAEWLNTIRRTRLGALTLGSGFKWSDLVCYSAGAFLGLAGEYLTGWMRRRGPGATPGSRDS